MKEIKFKTKSITEVITNSSSEVFTIYRDGGIQTIKKIVNAIMDINPDNKYTFDDLFDIKYTFNFEHLTYNEDASIEKFIRQNITEEEVKKLDELMASGQWEDYSSLIDFLDNNISYDSQLKIASAYEDEDWENEGTVIVGIDVIPKENTDVDEKVVDNVATVLSNFNGSIWEQEARYC